MGASPLNFTLAGAILPQIAYKDLNNNAQTLAFRFPPRQVNPIAPVPIGADNTASDGTMWTTNWYDEAYTEWKVTVLVGQDLTNWINFLAAAVNGQVMTLTPNPANPGTTFSVRLMVQGRSNSSNSNIPTGDPRPKYKSAGVYEVDVVLRFESPSAASECFNQLNGLG